jgi:hypothetical protein
MTIMNKLLAGTAGLAALAAAAPASAQWGYQQPYAQTYSNQYVYQQQYANPYAYQQQYANPYAYQQQYTNPYAYQNQYAAGTQVAAQQCSAAVQQRLQSRQGLTGVVASLLGVPTASPRVVSITQVTPRQNSVRIRGLASSGRNSGYGAYGVGAYGALGYAYQPDISFACTVDYRGYVRDVDINRR